MRSSVIEAYQIEQEYLNDERPDKMPLIERLMSIGYNTLEEYFYDKREYLISIEDICIKHYSLDEVKAEMDKSIESSTSNAFAIDEDCIWAWIGNQPFDYDKAQNLNVKPCVLGYRGGTIITSNSDFNVAICFNRKINIDSTYYLEKMKNFLVIRGYDVYIDGNDIMSGKSKIAGSSFYGTDKSGMFFMSLSLTDHSELVRSLCEKTTKKIPGFLTGITKLEIEQEVNKWLKPNI